MKPQFKLGINSISKCLPALALILLLFPLQANSFKSLIFYHGPRLADDTIEHLSELAREPKGAAKVGSFIGKERLTPEGIEDAFMRIAVRNGVISEDEALGMFSSLSGVKGFSSTLRKVMANKQPMTQGHLNELRIADSASQRGFSVLGIGQKFDDGIKKASSDIDIVLEKNGTIFALEAKDYAAKARFPMDQFRADMETLRQYKTFLNREKVIPVFSVTRMPDNPQDWKRLLNAAEPDVRVVVGSPDEQAVILRFVERIS